MNIGPNAGQHDYRFSVDRTDANRPGNGARPAPRRDRLGFYLSVLHTAYFLFMHYTESFHRQVPADPNWFRESFLVVSLAIPMLQTVAFARTVRARRARRPR